MPSGILDLDLDALTTKVVRGKVKDHSVKVTVRDTARRAHCQDNFGS